MATISTQLRNFKEPTKEQLTQLFFSLPPEPLYNGDPSTPDKGMGELEKMEISAMLTVSGEEPCVSISLKSLLSLVLILLPISDGKVALDTPISCICVSGQEVSTIHHSTMYYS